MTDEKKKKKKISFAQYDRFIHIANEFVNLSFFSKLGFIHPEFVELYLPKLGDSPPPPKRCPYLSRAKMYAAASR